MGTDDDRLAEELTALGHPVRLRLLRVFCDADGEQCSPAVAQRQLTDISLGTVSYHVRVMHAAGLLTRTGFTPRRGAVEHHYRATDRAHQLREQLLGEPAP